MDSGTYEFVSPRDCSKSPLALNLFRVQGVNRVFYGPDFISVTKTDDLDWNVLKPEIYGVITSFFSTDDQELFLEKPMNEVFFEINLGHSSERR